MDDSSDPLRDRDEPGIPGADPILASPVEVGRTRSWRGWAMVVLVAGILAVAWVARSSAWMARAVRLVESGGVWSGVIYVGLYAVAVVAMIPGSALTLAGGYVFGVAWGTALVSLASTVGAALAFAITRGIGRDRVGARIARHPRFASVDRAVAERGAWVVFLLRLSPLFPFNVLNYALGLTAIRFWPYVAASWAGMLPGTLLYVMIGASFGPRGRPGGLGPWYWAAIVATTVAATAYVARLARRALADSEELR